jgi:hypothetical protein
MRMIAFLLTLVLCGCATSGSEISPALRRAAAAITFLEGAPPSGFQIVGEVRGLSCAKRGSGSPDISVAKDELRLEAAKLGATVVASIVCQEGTFDTYRCDRAIECTGDAGRLP